MTFPKHGLVFLGCTQRYQYASASEKTKELNSIIQYWSEQKSRFQLSSVSFLVAQSVASPLASLIEKSGKELACFLLPSANTCFHAVANIVNNLQSLNDVSSFLVVNSAYLPSSSNITTLLKNDQADQQKLLFLKGDKSHYVHYPRLVTSLDGNLIGSVERVTVGISRTLAAFYTHTDRGSELPANRALSLALDFIGNKNAVKFSLSKLYDYLEAGQSLTRSMLDKFFSAHDRIIQMVNGRKLTGAEIEKTSSVDLGVYLTSGELLQKGLHILANNQSASGFYLDLPGALATLADTRIEALHIQPEMLENNLVEAIYDKKSRLQNDPNQDTVQMGMKRRHKFADNGNNRLRTWLLEAFGSDKALIKEKYDFIRFAIDLFYDHFGEGELSIGRSAAPVSILGRHLEDFGGMINAAAISRECLVLIRPTTSGKLRIRSPHPNQFGNSNVDISDMLADLEKNYIWKQIEQNKKVQHFVSTQQQKWMSVFMQQYFVHCHSVQFQFQRVRTF
ncbi:MAG: hypothetical protein DWQ10_08855 [Calditrichaeota bacterium]|nr:MAG: hypothetical protein DWQ10_08855 [Calditrichota bacterium]